MAAINPAPIDQNHHKGLVAADEITGAAFAVQGTSADGAINVNASLTPSGTQDVNLTQVAGVAVSLGQKVMASSIPITIASNQSNLTVIGAGTAGTANSGVVTVQGIASMTPVQVSQATAASLNATVVGTGTFATQNTETRPGTASLANVTMTGSSVTAIASNASRRGAAIYNDSGVVVYVKFGSTASSTSFTVKLIDQAYYELAAPCYTGIITALGASGDIRVTELT